MNQDYESLLALFWGLILPWKTANLALYSSMRSRARPLADSMIETGCCSEIDEGQVRSAPSVAAAVVAALSGEDGV
jgi:hypothetical protein